jgi:hypothetical protein
MNTPSTDENRVKRNDKIRMAGAASGENVFCSSEKSISRQQYKTVKPEKILLTIFSNLYPDGIEINPCSWLLFATIGVSTGPKGKTT